MVEVDRIVPNVDVAVDDSGASDPAGALRLGQLKQTLS